MFDLIVVFTFATTFALSLFWLIAGIINLSKAIAHIVSFQQRGQYTSFNFLNALWEPKNLTQKGQRYRNVGLKQLIKFVFAVTSFMVLAVISGAVGT